MTKIFTAASVVLGVAAMLSAQVPPRSNYQYVSDGASAEMFGSSPTQTYSMIFTETIQKKTSPLDGVWLDFSFCSQAGCTYGSGSVPTSSLTKVQLGRSAPAMVSLAVGDLYAIPGFLIWGDVVPAGPLSISATLRATNQLRVEEDVARTTENLAPDGTLFKDTVRGRSVAASAQGVASINGIQLEPHSSARVLDQRSVVHAVTVTKLGK